MPTLLIRKGPNSGKIISLDCARLVLGRSPDCEISFPEQEAVSREHATIRRVKDRYYIEDGNGQVPSRNHTFVNEVRIVTRTLLKHDDEIRICDNIAVFVDPPQPPDDDDADDEPVGEQYSSTVEVEVSGSSSLMLESQPADKLRALLDITATLGKTLDLEALLPKIVDSLFHLFRRADRAFLILVENDSTPGRSLRLLPKVVKTRQAIDESTAPFSRSIIRRCLEKAQGVLIGDAARDDSFSPSQSVVDIRIRSVICAPLIGINGKPFGVIQLDAQDHSKRFSEDDLKFLCGVANQAAIAMENARLHEDAVAQAKVKRDLAIARQVQLSFLPESLPEVAGYKFAAHYEPALAVGGDYYGFIPMPDGQLAVAIGDVAGKGIAAALVVAKLSSEVRYCLHTELDPPRAVAKLNDLLAKFLAQSDKFITLSLAVLDPVRHRVTLVSAGHPSPLLIRPGASIPTEVMPRRESGMALGILQGSTYGAVQLDLMQGDALLLYTDGVTDAESVQKKQFRLDGVQFVLGNGVAGPKNVVDGLLRAVQVHAAGSEPFDDITMVALGREL